jgi:hypothetical protein
VSGSRDMVITMSATLRVLVAVCSVSALPAIDTAETGVLWTGVRS